MDVMFIECRSGGINIDRKETKKLPSNIALASTVQHVHHLKSIQEILESEGKHVEYIGATHAIYPGQVLGCSKFYIRNAECVLFVGTGSFHPKAISLQLKKKVFVLDPDSRKISVAEDASKYEKRIIGAYKKFLSSERIGVLVSTKKGQRSIQGTMKEINSLEKRFPEKKFYFLLFDTLNIPELENFTFIECFLNTACPNIAYDEGFRKPVLNLRYLLMVKG